MNTCLMDPVRYQKCVQVTFPKKDFVVIISNHGMLNFFSCFPILFQVLIIMVTFKCEGIFDDS